MEYKDKILIGGRALIAYGSSRNTLDIDYLIDDKSSKEAFLHDNGIDYCNANGNNFFKAIYKIEKGREIATPQSLLELKAYAFVQHCQNFNFQKADDCEYDIKFLVRKYGLKGIKTIKKYLHSGELNEVEKIVKSVRK
jgi:hypothetical protein